TYTTQGLSDGGHNLTAAATDAHGQTSVASAALAVTIDTHAPVAPTMGVYSQAGSAVGGTTTLDDLVLKGTAEANSTVKLFDGAKAIGSVTASSDGTWTYTTKVGFSNSVHTYTAQEVDSTGNVVAKSSGQAILGSSSSNKLTSTAGDDLFVGNGGS